jgi:SulP family sulfate permease
VSFNRTSLPDDAHRIERKSLRLLAVVQNHLKDTIAGAVASVILIANIISFAALMFPDELSSGIPIAIWAMLIGSCVGGLWVALATSLPPIASGIDSPTGAVLVLLSAGVGVEILAGGGSPQAAVQTIMLLFTAATFISGASLYVLGFFRWGAYFRFVPYFVVGGFLATTGVFLIVGGVRMTAGQTNSIAAIWITAETPKLAGALATFAVLWGLRRWVKWPFAVPVALVAMCLMGIVLLNQLGLSAPELRWYLPSLGTLSTWSPIKAFPGTTLDWTTALHALPELLVVTIVALISLVTKVTSIEVARQASGDLDCEFRAHGIGSLIAAPLGGITSSLQPGTSRLLEHIGGVSRMSGVACALVLGIVAVANLNLPALVPIPVIAGILFYLGYTFLIDALWRPIAQRAWLDLLLAIGIVIVCINYGYLFGVLVGILCACVLFAISYAQIGVVYRHVTRAQFASYVDRSAEAGEHLRQFGNSIQVYWLSGYIFFGSSEALFERIRCDIQMASPRVEYVILDFGMVSGIDSSAIASLIKLRNLCDKQSIVLVFSALLAHGPMLERSDLFHGKKPHRAFPELDRALGWCEDKILAKTNIDANTSLAGFEAWLQGQLGANVRASELVNYLERKDIDARQILYREGEPADTIDLVAFGDIVIDLKEKNVRVRRIVTHSVVGEMGFYRRSTRSATVSTDGPTLLFTLTRSSFERLLRERPDLANAFNDFIVRTLADRVDSANRAVSALSH